MPSPDPAASARLSLDRGTLGHLVDGVWWPRSADLEQEITSLVAAVADARAGRVERVLYDPGNWLPAPRRRSVSEGEVEMQPCLATGSGQVVVVMNGGGEVVLRVIPASTSAGGDAVDDPRPGEHPALGDCAQSWFGTGGPAARPTASS